MIWHPLLIAVLALDTLALGSALYAASCYLRLLLGADPESSEWAEGAAAAASLAMRYGLLLFAGASLLLVAGISLVLPELVSGAMCGKGVITAMGSWGPRVLALRGVALAALWIWRTLDGINRALPRPPAVLTVARWQLLALPLLGLATLYTLRALQQLDPRQPVGCCQAVYETLRAAKGVSSLGGLSEGDWLVATLFGGALFAGLTLGLLWRLRGVPATRWLYRALALAALAWLPLAALTPALAADRLQASQHHCLWCLFSFEAGAVGYPLYGALLLIALESLAALAAARLALSEPVLAERACQRQRWALWAILAALLLFAALMPSAP